MKLLLTRCGRLDRVEDGPPTVPGPGQVLLTVDYCAICRTDAKMWQQGHRDLALPRVPGHEIAGHDAAGRRFTVWPGQACGYCRYCKSGRENLCEKMRVIGFHSDGGFARHVIVPRDSLIPADTDIDTHYLTFAEPAACVFNGLSQFSVLPAPRIIIYGGGVMGMIAALICREQGGRVTVIERNQRKISRLQPFCTANAIEICKDTTAADFDLALNCCDSPIAFSLCISKLGKGGRLIYFSGLEKNNEIGTNLLNLIHYKELRIHGAYGPCRRHMRKGVAFCTRQQASLGKLVEKIILPEDVPSVMASVLAGDTLKYIITFEKEEMKMRVTPPVQPDIHAEKNRPRPALSPFLQELTGSISPITTDARDQAQHKVDLKTKPLGALGKIEALAVQISALQNDLNPAVDGRRLFVFAGDHGIVEEGVSAFPAKVTVQMVENFLAGGAAINTFCRHYGIELFVVDMGVNGEFDDHPMLLKKKVAPGTRNFAIQDAMTRDDALRAMENGARVFLEKNRIARCDLVGMGEMGIGNTTSATAIICAASGLSPVRLAGRGTGVDDRGLKRKIEVIDKALALHPVDAEDGLALLAALGGYELGGICGAVLAAASQSCAVVLDGIISTAAGLIAYLICPQVGDYLIAGHQSVEIGQRTALDIMGLAPVVDLDMRLGEGTGAAITMNLADLACRMMREMASFEDAGVDSGDIE